MFPTHDTQLDTNICENRILILVQTRRLRKVTLTLVRIQVFLKTMIFFVSSIPSIRHFLKPNEVCCYVM